MRDFFINIIEMPTWIKITIVIVIIVAILAAGAFLYLTNRPVEWDDQPVMLRLLKGEVLILGFTSYYSYPYLLFLLEGVGPQLFLFQMTLFPKVTDLDFSEQWGL